MSKFQIAKFESIPKHFCSSSECVGISVPKSLMGSSASTQDETKAHFYYKICDLRLVDKDNLQPETKISKLRLDKNSIGMFINIEPHDMQFPDCILDCHLDHCLGCILVDYVVYHRWCPLGCLRG